MDYKEKFVKDLKQEYHNSEEFIYKKLLCYNYSKYHKPLNVDDVNPDLLIKTLKENPQLLACINNQNYEMIKIAITKNGNCILFVKWDNLTDEQAEEISLLACSHGCKSCSNVLKNYKKLTRKIVIAAIIGWTEIWFYMSEEQYNLINNQESMNEIVNAKPYMYDHIDVEFKTEELTIVYVESGNMEIKNTPEKYLNKSNILKAIDKNRFNLKEEIILKYIDINEYKYICINKIKESPENISFIIENVLTKEFVLDLVKLNSKILMYYKTKDIDILYDILTYDKKYIKMLS